VHPPGICSGLLELAFRELPERRKGECPGIIRMAAQLNL